MFLKFLTHTAMLTNLNKPLKYNLMSSFNVCKGNYVVNCFFWSTATSTEHKMLSMLGKKIKIVKDVHL